MKNEEIELLADFVGDRELDCPSCGDALRTSDEGACAACGCELTLRVGSEDLRVGSEDLRLNRWIEMVVAISLPLGFLTTFTAIYVALAGSIDPAPRAWVFSFGAIIYGSALAIVISKRRAFLRLNDRRQLGWGIFTILGSVAGVIAIALMMFG